VSWLAAAGRETREVEVGVRRPESKVGEYLGSWRRLPADANEDAVDLERIK
jgi:hypothetical protein